MDSGESIQDVVDTAAEVPVVATDDGAVETLIEEVSIDGMCGVY